MLRISYLGIISRFRKNIISKTKKIYHFFTKAFDSEALAARGSFWLITGGILEKSLKFIRNIILTRLLAPEIFGLMAMVLSISFFFESLTYVGFDKAIVQNPEGEEPTFLNGVWWFSLIRSIFIYIAGFLAIPLIAKFYNNEEMILVMRIVMLAAIFTGTISVKAIVAKKRMQFRVWVMIYSGGSIFGVILCIILAFFLKNVWALAIGFVIEAISRNVISYIVCPFRPGLNFNMNQLRSLFKYTRGMIGIPLLYFIFSRIDIFVIAKFCTQRELGIYSVAITLAKLPLQFIGSIIDPITMSLISKSQKDNILVNRIILFSTAIVAFVGFPSVMLVAIYGKEILAILYGAPYSLAFFPFLIIFVSELLRVCSLPISSTYFALGYPNLHRRFVIIRAVLLIIIIYPLVKLLNLTGAALSIFIAISISYYFQALRVKNFTLLNLQTYSYIFLKGIAILSIGLTSLYIINTLFSNSNVVRITSSIIACICVFGFSIFELNRVKSKIFSDA